MTFTWIAEPLAERGFKVFPVYGITPWGCQCGKKECHAIAKHPIISGWKERASSSVDSISTWTKKWPKANVGILTGNKLLVVDVDDPSSPVSKEILPLLPETLSARTGRGFHHFYSVPLETPLSANAFGGLDVRYTGAYVLGAGSKHKSGKRYAWENALPIVALPEQVIERLVALKGTRGNPSQAPTRYQNQATLFASPAEVWGEGERYTNLFRYAAGLQAKGWKDEQILTKVETMNLYRCHPPLEQEEVERIARSVLRYQKGFHTKQAVS